MFYSQFILAKKGPLGTIWIAAHLERKLRKNQVADTDIGISVDSILFPDVPIALRLSSHLLLGVVRIYSRKVNYLFDDCSEALLKIKQTFRSATVDLPPEESKAPYHSITLPETFDLDDFELPDNDIFQGNFVDHHISSREQITLQDTMEGVGYSTSKFGLDERFGDCDSSQLDLDEELFLDKIGPAGHANESAGPRVSVGSMTPLKQDEHPETRSVSSGTRVDLADNNGDLMDYAQAPCTPRLVEEPNISNVRDVSACDDHLESEYHLVESNMTKNAKNNKQEVNWCSGNDTNSDGIHMVLDEENVCQSGLLNVGLSTPQGDFPIEATTKHVLVDEPSSGSMSASNLLVQVKILDSNPTTELVDKIIEGSDVPCIEDLQNGSVNEDKNSDLPVDRSCGGHQGPYEIGLDKNPCEISGPNSTCQQVYGGSDAKDPGSLGVEVPCSVETAVDQEKSCLDASDLASENQDGSFPQEPEMQGCHETTDLSSFNLDVHEKGVSTEALFPRPCITNMQQSDMATSGCDIVNDADVRPDVATLAASEDEGTVMQASIELDSQVHNASHDLVENSNNSAEAELPAPETMLSVPEGLTDPHRNMILEGSPGELAGLNGDDTGSKIISGKKRGFTESTLTERSLNSVESSRLVRFKRTVESVPDDNDLLSSILVGRSSVLKVKPTPRLSEVTSMKRTLSASRTGAPKRKVLMDDTMVLHGDTIRQQLTNTEDIRRVRKKAPCTWPEISMIQKQYLEDEIFLAPVCTGISTELSSLHSQMWDLSGIAIRKNDLNGASLEFVAEPGLHSENGKNSVSLETKVEWMLTPNNTKNCDTPTAAELYLSSQSLETDIEKGPGVPNVTEQSGVRITSDVLLDGDNVDGKVGPDLSQCEILPDVTGVEPSEKNDGSGDKDDASAGVFHSISITETCETNPSVNTDMAGGVINQKMHAPPIELDSAGVNVDHEQSISGDALTNKHGDISVVNKTEPLVRDGLPSEMIRDDGTTELLTNAKHGELEDNGYNEFPSVKSGEHTVASLCLAHVGLQDDGFMNNVDNSGLSKTHQTYMMDAENSRFDLHDQEEPKHSAAGNDTDFLNVDDDELAEIADGHIPEDEEAQFTENTGWSSRTRAVSQYLQTLFVKEAEFGRKSLSMDNLLVGKSRKEASRMFFEALVLKTRDYVHVEQQNPFDAITIKPRTMLMRSDF